MTETFIIFQVLSNVLYLYSSIAAFIKKLYLEGFLLSLITIVSISYHLCYETLTTKNSIFCFFASPHYHQDLDTLVAGLLVSLFFLYLNPLIRVPEKKIIMNINESVEENRNSRVIRREYPVEYVIIIISNIVFGLIFQYIVGINGDSKSGEFYDQLRPFKTEVFLIVFTLLVYLITITVHLNSLNIRVIHRSVKPLFGNRLRGKELTISLILLVLSFILSVTMGIVRDYYQIIHPLWHVSTGLSSIFFIKSIY